jgi:hypothetical protein
MYAPGRRKITAPVGLAVRLRAEAEALRQSGIGGIWRRLKPWMRDALTPDPVLCMVAGVMPEHVRFTRLTRRWRVIARAYRPEAARTGACLYLSSSDSPDPALALATATDWAALATGGVQLRITTGNHLTMLDAPHVAGLARLIEENLQAVLST